CNSKIRLQAVGCRLKPRRRLSRQSTIYATNKHRKHATTLHFRFSASPLAPTTIPKLRSKVSLEPRFHSAQHTAHVAAERTFAPPAQVVLAPIQKEPDAGRMDRITDDVDQARDVLRNAEPHGHVKHFFRKLDRAFHLRAAAREHDACCDHFLETRAAQLLANQREQFLVA